MKPNKSSDEGSTVEANPSKQPQAQAQVQAQHHQDLVIRSSAVGIEAYIEKEVEKLTRQSRLFQDEDDSEEAEVALFHRHEVMTASLIGNGAFSEVYLIWGFRLSYLLDQPQRDAREEIVSNTLNQQGYSRYVMKHLRRDLLPKKSKFVHAAADLVMEAKFLSKLDHPNIVKLRGWSGGPESYAEGSHDDFFLVLDRLDHTLSHRIMTWQMDQSARERVYSKDLFDHQNKLDFALQIAKALDYLHDRDIIFRDLKPDNIGFKGNTVQIFDFGLCRELPEECPDEEKYFHMSGVGTRRYMAPEVFLGQHYNLKADVYSWTIVFHAMVSLQKPFGMYNAELHKLYVCEQGLRPTILPEWPSEIQQLCRTGWAQDPTIRPSIKEVCHILEALLESMEMEKSIPGQNIIEASLDVMGNCTNHLCKDIRTQNKHIGNVLRLLEMNMVGGFQGSTSLVREHIHTDYPNLQHLRSQYL